MSTILISVAIGVILAYIHFTYMKNSNAAKNAPPPTIEASLYVFAAAFGLSYLVMYAMGDNSSAAMNEIEVGEPDF